MTRTRALTGQVARLERKFFRVGIIVPDNIEDALREQKLRRRHLDQLYREYGRDLREYLIDNALELRERRQITGFTFSSDSSYGLAENIVSHSPDEVPDERSVELLRSISSVRLGDLQHEGRCLPWYDIVWYLQAHLAMYVLRTAEAVELRGEIYSRPAIDIPADTVEENDSGLYYDFADQPKSTLWTCLFPWLEVWLPRRRDPNETPWVSRRQAEQAARDDAETDSR